MNKIILPGSIIGILGGGQLGRMTSLAASNMGYKTHIFCDNADSPAAQVSHYTTIAPYDNMEALQKFAESVDVISFEFENIPEKALKHLEQFNQVRPRHGVLNITKNRLREKQFCIDNNIPTNKFHKVNSAEELQHAWEFLSSEKAVLKTCEMGYDGKGQAILETDSDFEQIWQDINTKSAILEKFIPFKTEISVIIARGIDTKMLAYPPAENFHKNGILIDSNVPANISDDVKNQAIKYAKTLADKLHLVGLLAVEFFVLEDGSLLVNEMAPRPHNSGHWSMDGCNTSQFEQFIRAICGLELGNTNMHSPTKMHNLIGNDIDEIPELAQNPNIKIHLYGKTQARKGRKMGHVNYLNPQNSSSQEDKNNNIELVTQESW